ncbi:MAG: UDP-2,3-diacylglucosamine diphosphatase [Fimbriimonadaceae bacterium]|nr:MAG: UDP-2,3-diacylglucosamine diphosphatase [Fimbriimonadaceae bacterium]
MLPQTHFRSVFVSDIHLGAVGSQTEPALRFLESVSCDYLYLVGDVIDGWVGRKDRKWTPMGTGIIREVLEKGNKGTVVRYTPGNHDAFMRRMHGVQLGNIFIEHSFLHTTADGRDLLVVHGDLFDRSCTKYQPVAFIGAWAYEYLGMANSALNKKRNKDGKRPIDFTTVTKRGIKKFIGKATNYEQSVMDYARESGFDGVVCGHVHRPQIQICDNGFVYVNTGDWVEHCTAVVEHEDGRLELLRFSQDSQQEFTLGAWEAIKKLVSPAAK